MSCETTLVRLEGRDGSGWVDPALVMHLLPSQMPGHTRVMLNPRDAFIAVGTPDEVHRMLFPEEAPDPAPPPIDLMEELKARLKPEVLGKPPDDCEDGILPDGPVCPRCGLERAPSGIGGGTWVHVNREHQNAR